MTRDERLDRIEEELNRLESANDELSLLVSSIETQSSEIEQARQDISEMVDSLHDFKDQPTRCYEELPDYSFDRCCRITGHDGECLPFTQIIGVRTA